MDLLNWLAERWELVGGVAGAALTALTWIYKRVLLPRYRLARKRYDDAIATLERVDKRLGEVEKQVQANGGSSLADAIKRIEERSTYQHGVLMVLSDIQGIAFWTSDETGQCVYASNELRRIVGNDALGNLWISNLHPDDVAPVSKAWRAAVSDKRDFREHYRFQHADGRMVYVEGRGKALPHFVLGGFPGFVGYLREMTPDQWEHTRVARKKRRDGDTDE